MPSQEELRRRLKAGRALAGLTVAQLAERIGPERNLSARTLYKLEQGQHKLREPALRIIAMALELPYEWFTVDSIGAALAPRASVSHAPFDPDEFRDHLARLERELQDLRNHGGEDPAPPQPHPTQRTLSRTARGRAR